MAYEPKFPIGSVVKFDGVDDKFETTIVGFDPQDGEYFLLVDVPGSAFNGRILCQDDSTLSDAIVDWKYVGRRVRWFSSYYLSLVSKPGPDGCSCVRCSTFSPMATPNVVNRETQKAGLACFSCRSSANWWLEIHGWEKKSA